MPLFQLIALFSCQVLVVLANRAYDVGDLGEDIEGMSVQLMQAKTGTMSHNHTKAHNRKSRGVNLAAAETNQSASFGDKRSIIMNEIEFEINLQASDLDTKNKFILALIEVLGLGLCGIDRCYMGQITLGVIKGLTLGALGVWALLDYFGVIITVLSFWPSINCLGYRANFSSSTVTSAFILVVVALLLQCCGGYEMLRRWFQPAAGKESEGPAVAEVKK